MAPIPEARPRGDLIQLTATSFDSSPLRSSSASPTSPARPPSSSAPSPPLPDPPVLAKIMLASPPSGQNPYVCNSLLHQPRLG